MFRIDKPNPKISKLLYYFIEEKCSLKYFSFKYAMYIMYFFKQPYGVRNIIKEYSLSVDL